MSETFINSNELEDQATYEILARTVQRTFGKQSRVSNNLNQFLSYTLQNDSTLVARYTTIISYDMRIAQSEQLKVYREEALQHIKDSLKTLKDDYKAERELQLGTEAKKTVSFSISKKTPDVEEVEFVQTTMHAHLKKAYYKLRVKLELK
jgi:hypothetical protein